MPTHFESAGRPVTVPLVWTNCGVMGARIRLVPAVRSTRMRALPSDSRLACRRCNGLWYAAQRVSSYGRKAQVKKRRHKLGDYGQLWAAMYPPKPPRMWRGRTRGTVRRWSALSERWAVECSHALR